MRHVPAAAAVVGITVVLSSIVFLFAEPDVRWLVAVVSGLGILVGGVWFAANPFLRSSRCFLQLRMEVDMFTAMVRELHRQARSDAPPEAMERTRAMMHKAVDRMVATADEARPSAPDGVKKQTRPPGQPPGGRAAARARRARRLPDEGAQLPRQYPRDRTISSLS